MSVEQLSQRLQDLHFSLNEQIKAYQAEQEDSENGHADWENDESEDKDDEPEVINHDDKINALELAKDSIDEALDHLHEVLADE